MKFWNKWLRKSHRWLAIPMLILVPVSLVLKLTGNGAIVATIPQWEMVQSLIMLFLVISGAYLFFIPYWTKYKRNKRRSNTVKVTQTRNMTKTTI